MLQDTVNPDLKRLRMSTNVDSIVQALAPNDEQPEPVPEPKAPPPMPLPSIPQPLSAVGSVLPVPPPLSLPSPPPIAGPVALAVPSGSALPSLDLSQWN